LLGPLDRASVEQLVNLPLKELNIRFQTESKMIDGIWDYTSGMPHLVQDICGYFVRTTLGKRPAPLTINDLKSAVETSTVFKNFRKGVIGASLPLGEAIAGVLSLQADPKGEPHRMTNDEIVTQLEEANYKYDSREFELALNYLELRAIIRPSNRSRTAWTWVNEISRKAMADSIHGVGLDRWRADAMRRHNDGLWKNTFKILGRLT
jgi:hypothetical protein